MSDAVSSQMERLTLTDTITRIERQRAEIGKLLAEQSKFIAEQGKLNPEERELAAEAAEFRRDPWFVLLAALVGAWLARLPNILCEIGFVH